MADRLDSNAATARRRLATRRGNSPAGLAVRLAWWLRHRAFRVAVVAVLAGVATVAVLDPVGDREVDQPAPGPGYRGFLPGQGLVRPGERLIPELAFVTRQAAAQPPVELDVPFFEVLADGSVAEVPLTVPDHTAVDQLRPLSDGRLLVRGSRDLMPGVARPDGPYVEGVEFPLMVVGLDGEIQSDQDLRLVGECVT
jgi:hypothetical protein